MHNGTSSDSGTVIVNTSSSYDDPFYDGRWSYIGGVYGGIYTDGTNVPSVSAPRQSSFAQTNMPSAGSMPAPGSLTCASGVGFNGASASFSFAASVTSPSTGSQGLLIVSNSVGTVPGMPIVPDAATIDAVWLERVQGPGAAAPSGTETIVVTTDALGRSVQQTYDANGHVTGTTVAFGTDQAATTSFDWQGNNLTAVTDPLGNATQYAYNDAGEVASMTDPLGNITTYSYDSQGRLSSTTNRDGLRTDLTYDRYGDVASQTWYAADGRTVVDERTYTWDGHGHLLLAGNSAGTYTFHYDSQGQLIEVDEPFGVSLTFKYDAQGHRTELDDSFSGSTLSTYDSAGQLTGEQFSQGDQAILGIGQTYNAAGQVATQTRTAAEGSTVATSAYSYDDLGQLTDILHQLGDGTTLADFQYGYAAKETSGGTGSGSVLPASQLTSETENGVTQNYAYDAAGQLTGAAGTTYQYDRNGNRTGGGYVVGQANELLSDGTWNFTYDAEGNETKKVNIATGVTWTYGYDNANEMTKAQKWTADPAHGGTLALEADYHYDVFGNRVEKDITFAGQATQVQRFAYDGWNPAKKGTLGTSGWDVWADLSVNSDGSSSLTTRYIRGDAIDQLFARIGASGARNGV